MTPNLLLLLLLLFIYQLSFWRRGGRLKSRAHDWRQGSETQCMPQSLEFQFKLLMTLDELQSKLSIVTENVFV